MNYMLEQTVLRYRRLSFYSKEGEEVIRQAHKQACDIVHSVFNRHRRSMVQKVFVYVMCNNLDVM